MKTKRNGIFVSALFVFVFVLIPVFRVLAAEYDIVSTGTNSEALALDPSTSIKYSHPEALDERVLDKESNICEPDSSGICYEQNTTFLVTIPKEIALNRDKTAIYAISIRGDVANNEIIIVVPDESVTLYDRNGKEPVIGVIEQNVTEFAASDICDGGMVTTGTITAPALSAGDWSGCFDFTVTRRIKE